MLHRLTRAMSPAALAASVCALVIAGAGVGYSAAQIGTSDIKDNAVTSAKIKNGTVKKKDLVKEAKYKVPALNNGTQNDCVWTDISSQAPGLPKVGYRVDRFGTTHLTGIIMANEVAANGDGTCGNSGSDNAEAIDDLTAFTLPKSARPVNSIYRVVPNGSSYSILIIPGKHGLTIGGSPSITLPWGAVMSLGGATDPLFLDGVSFETAKAGVAGPASTLPRNQLPQALRQKLFGALGR